MAEPAVKKRILTKVRRQFIHKAPSDEDGVGERAELVATPEQLNEDSVRLLEPSFNLVETGRNIYVGQQFLNLNYKVSDLKVERQPGSSIVSLGIKDNNVDILPLEYCVKRLQSYGNLDLATWADRLVTHHRNYNEVMMKYFDAMNSGDPLKLARIAQGKQQSMLAMEKLESRRFYRKMTMFGTKTSLVPVSLKFSEGLVRDMGYNLEDFMDLIRENGIPGLFRKDVPAILEKCKQNLEFTGRQPSFYRESEAFAVDLNTKEGEKKPVNMRFIFVMNPAPEGIFVNFYTIIEDSDEEMKSKNKGNEAKDCSDDSDPKCKRLKNENSVSSNESCGTNEVRECDNRASPSPD